MPTGGHGSMNLNKLFPRLAIRAKLAIAFVLLAGFPLVFVAAFATRVKIEQLRGAATASLDHDVEIARAQMEQALHETEENVAYVARTLLADVLSQPTSRRLEQAGHRIAAFLAYKASLHQVKLIDEHGTLLLVAGASGAKPIREGDQTTGMYYAYRAQSLEPGRQLLLPVELSGPGGGVAGTIPAIAIVASLWNPAGRFMGAVAGEAHAPALFAALETGSPHLAGVTGLVDEEGFFLYHSERKRDWAHLLASRSVVDLQREFSPELALEIKNGATGTVTTGGQLVSFTALSLGDYGTGPLFLYRAVPLATLEAPVRSFMRWVGAAGLALGGVVLALAVVAANQFTRPIYQLREGMRRLVGGDPVDDLAITTNDELEDLAEEFNGMATALTTYRQRLEELVSERTRALHQTYSELAAVLAYSADAVIGVDAAGRVRVWNGAAESLFGYAAAEAIGRSADALLGTGDRKETAEAAFLKRKLDEGGAVVNFRTERTRKDGQGVPVSLTKSVIRDDRGEPLGYSLILRDASMQAKLEEQMRRSERLAAASVMATSLAHEVNNPLAIIANRIECMQRDIQCACPECKLEGDLTVLHEHTGRLMDVTRDLLGLASSDDAASGPVDVQSLVERVARLVEQTFSARGVRLQVLCPENTLPELRGNESALETVCLNLLLNAADATPAGGTVSIATRRAGLEGDVEVEVRDTGAGVPADMRDRIFEPFFTTKGQRGGTGLGLAVCRTVVERHGGRISLEAAAGGGTRFIVSLPVPVPVLT